MPFNNFKFQIIFIFVKKNVILFSNSTSTTWFVFNQTDENIYIMFLIYEVLLFKETYEINYFQVRFSVTEEALVKITSILFINLKRSFNFPTFPKSLEMLFLKYNIWYQHLFWFIVIVFLLLFCNCMLDNLKKFLSFI